MNTKIFLLLLLVVHSFAYQTFSVNRGSSLLNMFSTVYDARLTITNPSSDMLMYYSWFAALGYCEKAEITGGSCCPSIFQNNWKMIDYGVDPVQKKFNYVLMKSDYYKKFVFAFPGTKGTGELITELLNSSLMKYKTSSSIKVVKYFGERADGILNMAFSTTNINTIKNAAGYQVIFTGHSLGGAVATIMALNSVFLGKINPRQNEPVLITYGQPRTGNYEFATEVNRRISKIFRVVRNGDIVTTVPPCIINMFTRKCLTSSYFHIGGLHLMNKDQTTIAVCPRNSGEDLDGNCETDLIFDTNIHLHYFSSSTVLSKYCRPNNSNEFYFEEEEENEEELILKLLEELKEQTLNELSELSNTIEKEKKQSKSKKEDSKKKRKKKLHNREKHKNREM